MMSERMKDLLALANLKRWNVVPVNREQSVGEHTFRVAVIAWEIAERFNSQKTFQEDHIILADVFIAAISHDGPECLTGDLPSNLKRKLEDKGIKWLEIEADLCPWMKDINHDAAADWVVHIADKIESASWLSMYGTDGTYGLVNELQLKAHKLAISSDAEIPGLLQAAMEVAGEVWKNEWPILYKNQKKEAVSGSKR